MKARMHRFILHNDEIHEASEKLLSPGQVGLLSGWGVFSTIKVIDGVLFAFERHWARMSRDAALMVGLLSGWGVFSSIKVVDGVLVAFERAWAGCAGDGA